MAKARGVVKPQKVAHSVIPALELITPEIAGDWLSHNTHNRRLRDRRVRRYAAIMERKEWAENAETIKFDWNGILLDGQHRLAAIVVSGTPQHMLVARGLDPATYDTIDTGASRTAGDAFYVAGVRNAGSTASAYNVLYRYRASGAFAKVAAMESPTHKQLEELLEDEPRLALHVSYGSKISHKLNLAGGLASVLRYLMCEIDDDDGQLFWEYVLTGENLSADSPIFRLRERLLQKNRLVMDEYAAIAIKAWNFYRRNEKIKALSWRSRQEAMPVPL